MSLKNKFIEFAIRYLWVDVLAILTVSTVLTYHPVVDLISRLVGAVSLMIIIGLSIIGWVYCGRDSEIQKNGDV